ncbi:RagB/SusD family nutrient uptake outer membrane protein [Chitinophaga defluvii]|uniref:RagB/SusD family nutrient uptake outer membrane protein n=1 Tax=Chitinophaga defluvii TaxID=3163343 RepID=A0ABV2TDR8_9BACT
MRSFYIKTLTFFFLLAMGVAGCKKDFLNRQPLDIISNEDVFKDEALTLTYLYNIYDYMPVGYGLYQMEGQNVLSGLGITDLLDGSTDLLRSPSSWNESNSVMIPGLIAATYNPLENWGRSYQAIRKVHNLLNGLSNSPLEEKFKTRVMAEARFVRAFLYFDLTRRYGNIPLITKLQSFENVDSLLVAPTPATEVYDFIDQELTAIAEILPSAGDLSPAELGRATKEAAWALNGRSLLFAKKYERSAVFSKKVIDSDVFHLAADYNALFQSHGGNKEVIFEVMFNGTNKGHAFDNLFLPPSIDNGWGSQTLPTQEMVDSYEMSNGKAITESGSGYDPQNPYVNRDKRFYASIIYEGASIKGKTIHTAYLQPDDGAFLEGRTITGYYIRKFIDETIPFAELDFNGSKTSWKELRLGEVLLNYAEAKNEASGPDQTVYDAINHVRAVHGGLPGIATGLGKQAMFEKIVQERKVELAFEGHRFWDLRRWKLAEQVLNNKYFHGMKITTNNNGLHYEVVEITNVPKQVFLPKHYLMPFPLAEINKNKNLVQNTGY